MVKIPAKLRRISRFLHSLRKVEHLDLTLLGVKKLTGSKEGVASLP